MTFICTGQEDSTLLGVHNSDLNAKRASDLAYFRIEGPERD